MSFRVIGIGEILWDLLASGPQMGGAPANFAYHAGALGAVAGVVTRVGNDRLGQDIRAKLADLQLSLELLQVDDSAPTGTVAVELTGEGIPQFTIHENAAWDYLALTEAAINVARRADAICFGTLAQRNEASRGTIRKLLSEATPGSLRVLDVNLRQHFYTAEIIEASLQLANVLKLNDAELPVVAAMFGIDGVPADQIRGIAERFELRAVALTRGPRGSLLYANERWSECVSQPIEVNDTVGAGDAFTAALVMGLLLEMDLDRINDAANKVARHLCACSGATPPLPEPLKALFQGASS